MVHPNSGNPPIHHAGQKTPTTDDHFTKTYQTLDRPGVTDHDIHEDYMKDPPSNPPLRQRDPGQKEGAYEPEERSLGPGGMDVGTFEETGSRRLPLDQNDVEGTSVHPNNPPL